MYFDAAASTPLHPDVITAMDEVRDVYANPFSKHYHGHKATKIMDQCLKTIAEILGVSPDQLVITHGGTDGNRKVIQELQKRFGPEQVFCGNTEHSSIIDEIDPSQIFRTHNLPPCQEAFRGDACIESPPNPLFPPRGLDRSAHSVEGGQKPKAISLMHANNETGVVYDISEIRKQFPDALLHQDWVQGVGYGPIDLSKVDFATFSAHKFYGPKGVGILYIKNPEHFPKLSKDSHTKDMITLAGMTKAFELSRTQNVQQIVEWTNQIEYFLRSTFPDCVIHGGDAPRIPGIINVAFKDVRGSELMALLSQKESVSVSTGSACQGDIMAPTHVIKAIQPDPSYQHPIRISLHQFLTDEDIEDLCGILKEYVDK